MLVVEVRPIDTNVGFAKKQFTSTFGMVKPGTTKPFPLTMEEAAELAKELTKTANQWVMKRGVKA